MPWNQPGSGGRDPWGQKGGNQGPPDLDEIVKNVQKRLGGLFGGGRGGGGGTRGSGSQFPARVAAPIIILVAMVAWALQCAYQVEQGYAGIELRFGKYSETTGAGLRWHWWPIEEVILVNEQKVNTVEVGYRAAGRTRQTQTVPREALMLTADENIVDLQLAVQYDIKNATDLVFNVADDPDTETVVRGATESALREVVGSNTMDFVLTEGRPEVVQKTRALLQTVLDRYNTGINVIAVEMQDAQPPKEVKPAFDDAVKAREDQVRLTNEAEAYANDVIPRARGRAARAIQEAEAYKAAVIARAEGDASRFTQVLIEYRKAPEVTRERLYLDSMEQVFTNSSKLLIDQRDGNNVIYLPLDQLLRQRRTADVTIPATGESGGDGNTEDIGEARSTRDGRSRIGLRERRTDR